MHPRKQRILDVYGQEPATLDELAKCTIAVINSQKNYSGYEAHERKNAHPLKVVGFSWDIRYSDTVSNSHSAPLDGVQNFGRKADKPTSYPGYTGRVWIRYADEPASFLSSHSFEATLTHPGTGGAGSYNGPWQAVSSARFKRHGHARGGNTYPEIHCYSWDYRFFLADWPLLKENFEQERLMAALSGKSVITHHTFLWNDLATVAADQDFMSKYRAWGADPVDA